MDVGHRRTLAASHTAACMPPLAASECFWRPRVWFLCVFLLHWVPLVVYRRCPTHVQSDIVGHRRTLFGHRRTFMMRSPTILLHVQRVTPGIPATQSGHICIWGTTVGGRIANVRRCTTAQASYIDGARQREFPMTREKHRNLSLDPQKPLRIRYHHGGSRSERCGQCTTMYDVQQIEIQCDNDLVTTL